MPPPSIPQPRRVARIVPARSLEALVQLLVREGLSPDWVPSRAADRVVDRFDGDLPLLCRARQLLKTSTRDGVSVVQARGIAALNLAITEIEARLAATRPGQGASVPSARTADLRG